MKQQTYITSMRNSSGKQIDFERWNYKRIETCIKKHALLHKTMFKYGFYKDSMVNFDHIVVVDNNGRIVSTLSRAIFETKGV